MKYIEKKIENQPQSLSRHKSQPNSNYENYKEKDDLRKTLLIEQGYICCYCMQRIANEENMKIEHFKPYSLYDGTHKKEDLRLNYTNLFAVCKGGENSAFHLYHCDKTKQDNLIKLNPSEKKLMDTIKFDGRGNVYTGNTELDKEIDQMLNLNNENLRKARESVVKSIQNSIFKAFGGKVVTKSFLRKQIQKFEKKENGKYIEFCQVAVYQLQKYLPKAIDN